MQKLTLECNFHLYQQSHSHSDEDYLGLLRHREQLENVSLRRSIHFSSASCTIDLSHEIECFPNPSKFIDDRSVESGGTKAGKAMKGQLT